MSRRAPGEGSIAQRPNGQWSAALQVNGKRQYVYGKTEAEARKKLADLKRTAAVQNGLPTSGTKTVSDLLDAWLANVSGTLKPRTVAEYEVTCDRYIRPAIGRVRLSRLEPGRIQALYATLQMKNGKRAPAKVHATLHRAFRLAVLWRWLPENPCDRVVRPKYYPERKEVWTAEQLRAFLGGTVGDRLHPFWMLAVTTGCRFGELVGSRWTDVDFQAGKLSVERNLQRIKGKWVFSEPKTRAGRRVIALPPEGVAALRRQKAQQAEWRLKAGEAWHDNGLVFTSLTGQPLEPSAVTLGTQRACERLSLPRLTSHQLRHLHATLLLAEGVPIPAVSARLGHATPSITMSVYAHAVRRQDEEAAQVFRRVLAGS